MSQQEEIVVSSTMKRLVVKSKTVENVADCCIEVEEVDVPVPSRTEVLVKMSAGAVNPSDYGSWLRGFGGCPGKEGSGVVVATGGPIAGMMAPVGSVVGVVNLQKGQGTYSEYVTASVLTSVFVLREPSLSSSLSSSNHAPLTLTPEDAASFFVNPYTAYAILDTVKNVGARAFVHTAAASQLGQMLVRLTAPSSPWSSLGPTGTSVDVIHVVRRQDQADLLRSLGAEHVVVTDDDDDAVWTEKLRTLVKRLDATLAFDAIGSHTTGDLLEVLPKGRGSTVYVYGKLGGRISNVEPTDLIYHDKHVRGFFLPDWITGGGRAGLVEKLGAPFRLRSATRAVRLGFQDSNGWCRSEFRDTTPATMQTDLAEMLGAGGRTTRQKLRIRLDGSWGNNTQKS